MNHRRDAPTFAVSMLQRLIGSIVMGTFDEEVGEYSIDLNSDNNVEAYVQGYERLEFTLFCEFFLS